MANHSILGEAIGTIDPLNKVPQTNTGDDPVKRRLDSLFNGTGQPRKPSAMPLQIEINPQNSHKY